MEAFPYSHGRPHIPQKHASLFKVEDGGPRRLCKRLYNSSGFGLVAILTTHNIETANTSTVTRRPIIPNDKRKGSHIGIASLEMLYHHMGRLLPNSSLVLVTSDKVSTMGQDNESTKFQFNEPVFLSGLLKEDQVKDDSQWHG